MGTVSNVTCSADTGLMVQVVASADAGAGEAHPAPALRFLGA